MQRWLGSTEQELLDEVTTIKCGQLKIRSGIEN
jgi:hypothetical protein